jgi:AraC-like DNA-binding protein
MRLAEANLPVSMIADEVGLSNLANFTRQFRRIRQMTPTAYREYFRKHGISAERSAREDLLIRPPSLERYRRVQAVSQYTS